MNRLLSLLIAVAGVVVLGMGIFFVAFGMSKGNWMTNAMRQEKITLGLTADQIKAGDVVDTMAELQKAGDTIREHRHGMAPTYNDALAGGQFDPTNVAEAKVCPGHESGKLPVFGRPIIRCGANGRRSWRYSNCDFPGADCDWYCSMENIPQD